MAKMSNRLRKKFKTIITVYFSLLIMRKEHKRKIFLNIKACVYSLRLEERTRESLWDMDTLDWTRTSFLRLQHFIYCPTPLSCKIILTTRRKYVVYLRIIVLLLTLWVCVCTIKCSSYFITILICFFLYPWIDYLYWYHLIYNKLLNIQPPHSWFYVCINIASCKNISLHTKRVETIFTKVEKGDIWVSSLNTGIVVEFAICSMPDLWETLKPPKLKLLHH